MPQGLVSTEAQGRWSLFPQEAGPVFGGFFIHWLGSWVPRRCFFFSCHVGSENSPVSSRAMLVGVGTVPYSGSLRTRCSHPLKYRATVAPLGYSVQFPSPFGGDNAWK